MASYLEKTGHMNHGLIWGRTDVDKYVDWSTYIEFCHGWKTGNYGSEYGNRIDYVTYLQYWTGSRWDNVDYHVGYFSYSVCFKFWIYQRKAGSYRIRTLYTYQGDHSECLTNAFIVER